MRRFAGMVALLALAACRTVPSPETVTGDVGVSIILPPPDAARLELESSQAFVFPNLIEPVAMPEYPADLLPLHLPPVVVCVEVDISETGEPMAVRPRIDEACRQSPDDAAGRFAEAARQAALQWRFDPALICATPDGRAVVDACAEPDAIETPTALRLSYAFRFTQDNGKPRVERVGQ